MAELDQHRPTTSTFHRPTMEETVVKMKRLQRFTRQFSIFVHCEEDKNKMLSSTPTKPATKQDENNEDRLFKYPGNLRAIKRKRNLPIQSLKNVSVSAKRKMMAHQKSIREGGTEGPSEIIKDDIKADNKEKSPAES